MTQITILCLLEPANIGVGNNHKKASKTVPVVIEVQKSNGGSETIMLHGKQRVEFQYGDRIICRKGVLTLTFNPDQHRLSHSIALGYIGHLKTEMVVNNETVFSRDLSLPPSVLSQGEFYTVAGWDNRAMGTNR